MHAKKKPANQPPELRKADPASPLSGISATDAAATPMSGQSPARALQIRLARELGAPARSWLWHSTGLVLALLLSLSLAGSMLAVGL
jgi:hypothetical protein